jgi:diamine N-acetyltransferase
MICKVQSHQCIGTIDLFDFDPLHGRVGVGILIFEEFRKQGFAIEAINLVKHYVFETLLLKQVYCNISASNTESIALFEKCGFTKIGLKKQWNRLSTNEYEDEWIYQLIN